MSRNAFFSARSERKHFLWRWYCRKKHKNVKIEIYGLSCSVLLSTTSTRRFSFPIFFVLFCMLSNFAKAFERKVWRVQVAYLHNAARALSSPSRCFQLSTNLGKDFFRYLWYCDKMQIECGLAWHWWNSTDLGLIDMFLINLNAEIVACILSFRKSRHKPNHREHTLLLNRKRVNKGMKRTNKLLLSPVVLTRPYCKENRYLQVLLSTVALNSYLGFSALCKNFCTLAE